MGLTLILGERGAVRPDGLLPTHQGLLEVSLWEGGKGPLRGGSKEGDQWLGQEIMAASGPPV